jgi:hypothetical protein
MRKALVRRLKGTGHPFCSTSYAGTQLEVAVGIKRRERDLGFLPQTENSMFQEVLTELRQCAACLPFNVLILGTVTSEQRAEALQELRAGSERDAYYPQRRIAFDLPTVSTNIMVVIDEAADVSTDDQQTLLHWLEQHRDGMVLSFAINAIFPLVEQGKYLERLYYRLNVMTLNVNDAAEWSPGDRYTRTGTRKHFIGPFR